MTRPDREARRNGDPGNKEFRIPRKGTTVPASISVTSTPTVIYTLGGTTAGRDIILGMERITALVRKTSLNTSH
jgi:hypothetical protein